MQEASNKDIANSIADAFYDDIRWRSVMMKPLYDSRNLAAALILSALNFKDNPKCDT